MLRRGQPPSSPPPNNKINGERVGGGAEFIFQCLLKIRIYLKHNSNIFHERNHYLDKISLISNKEGQKKDSKKDRKYVSVNIDVMI